MNKLRGNEGLILAEMAMVIAILGALSSVSIVHYRDFSSRSSTRQCLVNRDMVARMNELYALDAGHGAGSIHSLVQANLLERDPVCASRGVYVWQGSSTTIPVSQYVICSIHGASVPVETSTSTVTTTLFSSDFSTLSGLTALIGNWSTKKGILSPKGKSKNHLAVFGNNSWTDYDMTVNATLLKKEGYQIYYRADGQANINGYVFQYRADQGTFSVSTVVNGTIQSAIQSVSMTSGFPVYDQTHAIAISVQGTHHTVSVDGQQVLDFNNSAYSSGSAGLGTWNKSKVAFDSVSVTTEEAQ